MKKYLISGVWKNNNDIITHYAVHVLINGLITKAEKVEKNSAVFLLKNPSNIATTIIWDYNSSEWKVGERVEVVEGKYEEYLRSNPDDSLKDNLAHLINYSLIL